MGEWLTDEQLQLIRCIEQGLTYEEMGQLLGMNPRTVKAHVDVIRLKVGVKYKRHIPRVLRQMGVDFKEGKK